MYDFRTLNDKEFEALTIDLLSVATGRRYERFKPGKDSGVDGRWFAAPAREYVVQCKHFLSSGVPSLLRHMEQTELPKIRKLNPAKYILITSLPLSRANKARLAATLAPFVAAESDIVGQEDLNDLLLRHPEVEQRHYKLWLTSSTVLRTLLNAAIHGRSQSELQQIRDEAFRYVVTSDYAKARTHLLDQQIVIITGEPGIGKTTLARQLILDHVASGYELAVIEESVSEAEAIYIPNRKQIFYFDDFLGRTYLEALRARQDSHILTFIKRVARDPLKCFVLTSRTNILNQGAVLTDLFAGSAVEKNRYELRVGHLTQMDKARILYNHMWHSELGTEFLDEIYKERRYRKVIDHRSYNPRLVAFVLDADKVADRAPGAYWDYIVATLDNPQDVWGHFFDNQMDQDGRDLVFFTVLNGGRVLERDLRDAFFTRHGSSEPNLGLLDHRFTRAARHCVGSVLDRVIDGDRTYFSLFNPSVADFVQRRLAESDLWVYYYVALRTTSALRTIEQIRKQPFFGEARFLRTIDSLASAERGRGPMLDGYSLRLTRILYSVDGLRDSYNDMMTLWLGSPSQDVIQTFPTEFIGLFNHAFGAVDRDLFVEAARRLPEWLEHSSLPTDEPELLRAMLETLERVGEASAARTLRKRIIDDWAEQMSDVVTDTDVLADFYDPNQVDDATAALSDAINDWLWGTGIDLSGEELDHLVSKVDVESVMEHNREHAYDEPDQYPGFRGGFAWSVDEVDDLFDRSNGS